MSDYDDYKRNKDDFDKFQRTEENRARERQIKYQESLGPVQTWREREIAALDMFEAQWKRGMAPKTY